jgi:hypothetical protein
MKTALGSDVSTVENTVESTLKWLEENGDHTAEVYEDKLKEVEGVLMPLIAKAYQSNAPPQQSETSATSDLD